MGRSAAVLRSPAASCSTKQAGLSPHALLHVQRAHLWEVAGGEDEWPATMASVKGSCI